MKLDEALAAKKQELEELQNDINSLESQAGKLKDSVKKYNELKSKSSDLKKTLNKKQKNFDIVADFFKNADESYLDNIFPMFGPQNRNTINQQTIPGSATA